MDILLASLGLALIVVAAARISARSAAERAQVDNERRIAQQVAEACNFIASINATRAFPAIWMSNVNAQPGEFGVLHETSTLFEMKTFRISMGAGTRLKIGKMPLYVGGSRSTPVESLRSSAVGDLYLTNRRVIFMSTQRSVTVLLKDVVGIDASTDSVTIHSGRRNKPAVFAVSNPAKFSLLLKLVSGESITSPQLPPGVVLEAQPTDKSGEVSFSATERSAFVV
jgi:hypothetical protein